MVRTIDFKIRIRELEIKLFRKDLQEVDDWIDELEEFHQELSAFFSMERQLLREDKIRYELLAVRRVNTLEIARFCKYQQTINTEMECGPGYCEAWIRAHQRQRDHYKNYLKSYRIWKMKMFKKLIQ
ncbi:MAG TPA: hypothetical protein ENH91_14635 [Leeuwenhoekiella sp.]|nr:hypothetical protein [Leeuwenhoekiella sp.]